MSQQKTLQRGNHGQQRKLVLFLLLGGTILLALFFGSPGGLFKSALNSDPGQITISAGLSGELTAPFAETISGTMNMILKFGNAVGDFGTYSVNAVISGVFNKTINKSGNLDNEICAYVNSSGNIQATSIRFQEPEYDITLNVDDSGNVTGGGSFTISSGTINLSGTVTVRSGSRLTTSGPWSITVDITGGMTGDVTLTGNSTKTGDDFSCSTNGNGNGGVGVNSNMNSGPSNENRNRNSRAACDCPTDCGMYSGSVSGGGDMDGCLSALGCSWEAAIHECYNHFCADDWTGDSCPASCTKVGSYCGHIGTGGGGNGNSNGGGGGNGNGNGGGGGGNGNGNGNGGGGGNGNSNGSGSNHSVCINQQCVEIEGSGINRCESDADCLPILENLYILTNPFNGLQVDYTLENNKVRFTLPATSGNLTWSLRGTSGGSLDLYTGNSVLYTPGTINGDEIVTVSDGTNKAYIAIDVRYEGGVATLQVQLLNELTMVAGLDFLLHTSLGADIGDRIQFKAIGQYRDPETNQISYKDITALVTWNSTDSAIGDIVPGGLFSALETGTTSVYAIFGDISSNVVIIHVNPTFPAVNPSGYEPHFNPNPMARGYTTRFWVFIETDTGPNDLKIVSADLSQFNISPVCAADSNSNLNAGAGECNSEWLMTPAEFEGKGRWYYLEFRVPFTVADGVYPVRIQATSISGLIDRHLTVDLRVVSEVIKGDISGDGLVTIQDAIYALQVAVGKLRETSAKINVLGDCNGDGHIGLPEAICVLHSLTQ